MGSLANYIDYESFGRDVYLDEGGDYTPEGYIYNSEGSINEDYDGYVPDEYKVLDVFKEDVYYDKVNFPDEKPLLR